MVNNLNIKNNLETFNTFNTFNTLTTGIGYNALAFTQNFTVAQFQTGKAIQNLAGVWAIPGSGEADLTQLVSWFTDSTNTALEPYVTPTISLTDITGNDNFSTNYVVNGGGLVIGDKTSETFSGRVLPAVTVVIIKVQPQPQLVI